MTEKKSKLLSIDVVYLVFALLLFLYYFEAGNVLDLLFFVVITVYYIRIKIYRWKKYHWCGIFILEVLTCL